jgi:hypothetical protein
MTLPKETKTWLLESPEPYIRYQALRLLKPDEADPTLLDDDPFIRENIEIIAGWKESILERHNKPDIFIHRLAMLADLGVTLKTRTVRPLVKDLLKNISKDGTFLIKISIPTIFGGTGEPTKEWIICDFPVVVYALLRMGVDDERLMRATRKLMELSGDQYYSCCGSIPKFKGPGPRGGMCPYANLLVARALAASPEFRDTPAAKHAARAVLDHWSNRRTLKPFLFGMGTDFMKLKFPLVWYNLLHVLSGLAGVAGITSDPRFREMLNCLRHKLDENGRVKPESIYMSYKTEEWSDKKKPSRLLTILAHQLLQQGRT